MHLKKGDIVQIIKGKDRPQAEDDRSTPSGKILNIDLDKGRVIVEGKNMIWKHMRKSELHPQGGRIQREDWIQVANVMLWNEESSKPERVHYKRVDGKKVRYFKSNDVVVDQ